MKRKRVERTGRKQPQGEEGVHGDFESASLFYRLLHVVCTLKSIETKREQDGDVTVLLKCCL